jgi:Protein of unknown function (DUF3631)
MTARPAGARLLDDLHAALSRYVVLPSSEAADAVVLWVAATHAVPAWEHATRLVIKSPEKRCGKSRLLDVIEATCHRPLITVSISTAALVRSVNEDDPPTILLDEADTVFGRKAADSNEDLRGILNAGHGRNRPYKRYDANARRVENCLTFAMAALAGIGSMPDTIEDRAVVVTMRRRAPGETVAPFRTRRDGPALAELRDDLHKWVDARRDDLQDAEPAMPVEDRAADTWESLVAVADVASADWPARARKAALVMCSAAGAADAERSTGMRLLADIRDVLDEPFIASADLVARLRKIEDAPWADFELTPRRLAARLREYGVSARHNSAKTMRGYWADDFADPFARYLASRSVQASENLADHGECPDTSPDTSETSIRPAVPADQATLTDAWTLRDAAAPADDPGQPVCAACATAMSPALAAVGWSVHPGCEEAQ